MLFNSITFFIFLAIVVVLYYSFPRLRMYILALANIAFYAYAGVGYFLLFAAVVTVVYGISKGLGGSRGKLALAGGLTVVLGNLFFFKYSIFLLENIERSLGIQFDLGGTFLEDRMILLPIGISFYSFQLIAYLVDVYRKKLQPSRTLLEFWVFISLFAHSAAGPILRGNDFLPQLRRIERISFIDRRFKLGIAFLLLGLTKKLIVVESIAPFVNAYFGRAGELTGAEAWTAAYLFAFQIYFDFSAYSEMAVGIGLLLGLKLDLNFKTPYLSANPNEFWRRWHITLSQWIRDYIFIPLGGSRVANWRIYANLIAAMTISGLWHGAAWTFIIWGVFHGVLSAIHRLYRRLIDGTKFEQLTKFRLYHVIAVIVFFHLTVIGWVFFRAEGIHEAMYMLAQMTAIHELQLTEETEKLLLVAAALYGLHLAESVIVSRFGRFIRVWRIRVPFVLRGAVYTLIATVLLAYLFRGESSSFIYFQF
ncbi:MBOAT family O-acyltransferase [Paenibacillus sp. PL2-23]|uniref:MBOAT family O-acyltransferase n=1 Tax=Paenibacillus sp. PL2-23 TaxID=2100729 RepID=UPI0030F98BE6